VTVTASIGIAPGRPDHLAMDELLREADIAMYVAKGRGPGSHVVFQAVHHAARLDRIRLRQELSDALAEERLHIVYQPQIDLRSGRVTAVEALSRWQHSTRGAVGPDEFVPLAEQSGLIGLLDGWVLRTACRQLRDWMDAGQLPLRVAVNISGSDLDRPDLVDHITRVLEETQIEPWRLELELTEGAAMSQQEDAAARLHRLRALGVRIAIDDFGTGYSMLSRLRDLPVDKLKLDKSFVADLGRDDDVTRIVRSAIDMGHGLGLTVVAEGVETERTLQLVKELGCDGAQGFFIAYPLPADQLPRWLRESPWAAPPSIAVAAIPAVDPGR
jgi:EAL domain-containing protein (putative c-di-GMP-specific phosphodiesterase class I)